MNDNHLLAAALAAAARGRRVFPLRPGSKLPALHGLRTCPGTDACADGHQGWEQRATTDPDIIHRCWSARTFNISLATGPSGLVVVDLDTRKSPSEVPPDGWNREGVVDGHDVFTAVCEQAGQPVPWETYAVSTARGGSHLYFTAPPGTQLRNTGGEAGTGLGWKVDTRAHGGYVVAAGSTTSDGPYTVTENTDPAELPGWLAKRLAPRPMVATTAAPVRVSARLPNYVDAAITGECERVAKAQPTNHTSVLFTASIALGQLLGARMLPATTAELALYEAAAQMVSGPCRCTEREVRRTITNGLRIGSNRPRATPAEQPAPVQAGLFEQRGAA
ncbi:bifunctional DNA primase/polymerase [Kutzneria sp. CA-103260]|uniref:bifunctional DNA primase/polymerase n=1 Tax=Kutzneria sp. CA-103260 TaxID=2802641 RepID=UPI001BA91464|nr:bifunctional DNA primase/polymerase [Kutzneria sp. CA-103260]QUQ71175.1 bifunctional DNA primase/polymerase [Kutzneria sp. CA-103260]